jgi:hypothetical protein
MKNSLIVPLTFLLMVFVSQSLQPQSIPHAILRGCVLDDSTRLPLLLANVFVSNSTIGAAADSQGRFELKCVPLGTQEVVASIVGYAPETKRLRLIDTAVHEVEFRLKPRAVQIEGVEVEAKEPKEWEKNLQRFLGEFLGSTPNAEQCKVLNPEVLDFAISKSELFTATARVPLEMENKALGYRVRLFLDHFTVKPDLSTPVPASAGVPTRRYNDWKPYSANGPDPVISKGTSTTMELLCRTQFKPLAPVDEKDLIRWKENRKRTYYGSERHFLISLVQRNSNTNGFEVQRGYSRWEVDPESLLSPGDFAFERKLSFDGLLHVIYSGGDETQKSSIWLSQPFAAVCINGMLADPLSITTYGYWATQRTADMLPIDYSPED